MVSSKNSNNGCTLLRITVFILFVTLGILSISYWQLLTDYRDLDGQLESTGMRRQSAERRVQFIQQDLNDKTEELANARQLVNDRDRELKIAETSVANKDREISKLTAQLHETNMSYDKCHNELNSVGKQLADSLASYAKLNQKFQDIQTTNQNNYN
ncbi:uncharacterized protein LOC128951933 [Oppia nitens]|uniref:uncharacterized protein LOC128951933 n=1 Tax=Oppia nitens TaxID=1686743 RepID=UPI0023DBBBA3|nr:uncharacterized protein LOC128951933 [Oppia nitens]